MNKISICGFFLPWFIMALSDQPGWAQVLKKPLIEVQVEITEVDHVKASRFGIEWLDKIGLEEGVIRDFTELGPLKRATHLRADLNFLVQEGAAELLANPNLVTDPGTTAVFHAGGEIPYITTSSLGTAHVEFKPYGIELKIQPELLNNEMVKMAVQALVSAPDQANGVFLSGNAVPALLERKVASHVTVESGTTMTMAGLVQATKEKTITGIPFLRKIPFLGIFFRWEKTLFRRTTIVMFVTPRILMT